MTCPHCQETKLFRSPLLAFKGVYNMHEECSVCGLKYEMEPGFWWGAMYIGYALSSAIVLSMAVLCQIILGLEAVDTLIVLIPMVLIAIPLNARLARIIWLNIYVSYDKNAKKQIRKTNS
jgi:uncharacterized protein (DUF983 family)